MFIQVFILFFVILLFVNNQKLKKKYPSGPWRLPIIGNIHQLGEFPQKSLVKMSEKFGPILSIKMGAFEFVVFNDYKIIKEAMAHPAFAGRPDWKHLNEHRNGRKGIIFTEGIVHFEQKRFGLRTLKDFGLNKSSMEGLSRQEYKELFERIEKSNGKSLSLKHLFTTASINSLITILFGERIDQNDLQFIYNLKCIDGFNPSNKSLKGALSIFPWIRYISRKWSGWNEIVADARSIHEYVRVLVKKHEETRNENEPRDFVDAYLNEISKTKDKKSSFHGEVGMESLVSTGWDFFCAGGETTSTLFQWICVVCATYPETPKKIREEMKKIAGNGTPSLADRPKMIYTEAFLNETFRISSIAYLGFPRRTVEDVEFHGYHIPAGTNIIANFYAAHNDKSAWGDPENFRPERFISQDGTVKKHEALMPFGSGKRVCLAETFVRDSAFIFITQLLKKFQIKPDLNNPEKPHTRCINSTFTALPEYLKVSFEKIKK